MSAPRRHRRLLAVLVSGLLPWTVVLADGTSLVFSFGLVSTPPFHVVTVVEYLFTYTDGLPRRLQAWPAGIVLHAGALACAVGGLWGREDPRLTGGLLLLAGLAHGQVAWGLYGTYGAGRPLVVPLGAVATWAVAWWYYWPLARERGLPAGAD